MSNKKWSDEVKQKALELHGKGHSQREVSSLVEVPLATVNGWIQEKTVEHQAPERASQPEQKVKPSPEEVKRELNAEAGVLPDGQPMYSASPESTFPTDEPPPKPPEPNFFQRLWGYMKARVEEAKGKFKWGYPSTRSLKDSPIMQGGGRTDWSVASDWKDFVDMVAKWHLDFFREHARFVPDGLRERINFPREHWEKIAYDFAPLFYNFQSFFFGGQPPLPLAVIKYLSTVAGVVMKLLTALQSGEISEYLQEDIK